MHFVALLVEIALLWAGGNFVPLDEFLNKQLGLSEGLHRHHKGPVKVRGGEGVWGSGGEANEELIEGGRLDLHLPVLLHKDESAPVLLPDVLTSNIYRRLKGGGRVWGGVEPVSWVQVVLALPSIRCSFASALDLRARLDVLLLS